MKPQEAAPLLTGLASVAAAVPPVAIVGVIAAIGLLWFLSAFGPDSTGTGGERARRRAGAGAGALDAAGRGRTGLWRVSTDGSGTNV